MKLSTVAMLVQALAVHAQYKKYCSFETMSLRPGDYCSEGKTGYCCVGEYTSALSEPRYCQEAKDQGGKAVYRGCRDGGIAWCCDK
ncbi:hypothetical protein QTJ16_003108 [Diplocarpon rosae]|uniref:Uncharacterized protein n=1 Tax=Diplocarpon rosae TaxID=946125 RepID=A0AAD9T1V8_9HELO|nr:hypothetical protein QTJ16_003108 [Diplocarpon rosae]